MNYNLLLAGVSNLTQVNHVHMTKLTIVTNGNYK